MYSKIIKQFFFYSAVLTVLLMPFSKKLTVLAIGLFTISWLMTGEWMKTGKTALKQSMFVLAVSFFLIHVIGLVYSGNMHSAWFDLEVKLTLLIFPLIFFMSETLRENKQKFILWTFVISTFFATLTCIGNAIYNYYENGLNTFSYMTLSIFHHPTYFALFICLSAVIILNYWFYSDFVKKVLLKIVFTFLLLFFAVFIYMLSSKAGIFSYFMALMMMSVPALFKKTIRFTSVLVILFACFQLWFCLTRNNRFQSVESSVTHAEQNTQTSESNAVRVLIWETTFDIIKENYALGVGTGDIKDELFKKYHERNMTGAIENKLNVHNQFLETWLGQGIPGITLLLLIFLIGIIRSLKTKDWMFLTFTLLLGFNFLFESMLNTQAGVVLFGFFFYYIASLNTKPKESINN